MPLANIGSIDRGARLILGAILLLAVFVPQLSGFISGNWGQWKYAVTAVGFVLLATAIFRFCPAYLLFGIRTCKA
jgi:hypothetical protein